MMQLNMILRQPSDSYLELTLPISFRLMFAAIFVVAVGGMISVGSASIAAIAIATIVGFGGLYDDRWRFNRETRRIEHRSGLIGVGKRTSLDFGEIDSLILMNFREVPDEDSDLKSTKRTIRLKSLVSFQIVLKNGRPKTVEIRNNKDNQSMRENAEQIAEFCGLPLEQTA